MNETAACLFYNLASNQKQSIWTQQYGNSASDF